MERRNPTAATARGLVAGREWARERNGRQTALAGALLALAAAAWVATDLRMAGMDAGPGTNPGPLGFYLSTWVVMMAAMMLPAITPKVLAYREIQHARRERRGTVVAGDTALFLAGYLAVWAGAGLIGYVLLEGGRSLAGGFFAWGGVGRWTATGVLVVGALYQLTPFKTACLARCAGRRALLQMGSRGGRDDALRAGVAHGVWCLGCCWALMAALFALGAMSVDWMVLISALIAAERLLPWRRIASAIVVPLLAVVAIGVAVAPARVPMLTIPGSPTPMRAMGMSPSRRMHASKPTRMPPRMGSMQR
jgi:predicted metal-binding membrane protein